MLETQPIRFIGGQAKPYAAGVGEQPQQNAASGHEFMQRFGTLGDQPLEQCAAALRLETILFKQQRQTLAGLVSTNALSSVPVRIRQARLTQHSGRTADRPRPDLFGQQLEQLALGQYKTQPHTGQTEKNLPKERSTIKPI